MVEAAYGRDADNGFESGRTIPALESALERLRLLVIQTMDSLADGVLEQIQTARAIVDQTDALLAEVRLVTVGTQPGTAAESHLRQVSAQIEESIRDLPESSWDTFGQLCTQLARMVAPLQQGE